MPFQVSNRTISTFFGSIISVFCNKSTLLTKAERQNKANECKSFLPYILLYVSYHFKLAVSKINLEITPFFSDKAVTWSISCLSY